MHKRREIFLVLVSLAVVFALPMLAKAAPDVLWGQPSDGRNAIASQYFPDFGSAGVYIADDFHIAHPYNIAFDIEFIFVDGNMGYSGGLVNANSLNWVIYPDAIGVPGGYPDIGGELWSHSCLPSAPEVTFSGANSDQVTLDVVRAQGSPLHLTLGTYWLCFYPSLNFMPYGQWHWDTAGTINLASARFIDPSAMMSSYTSWTPWPMIDGATYDAAFRLEGTQERSPEFGGGVAGGRRGGCGGCR